LALQVLMMADDLIDDAKQVGRALEISRQIQPMLAGLRPDLQGAVLADLTSMWVAAHMTPDRNNTQAIRAEVLKMHVEAVLDLIDASEQEILAKILAKHRCGHEGGE
jgi:hypothetical protein